TRIYTHTCTHRHTHTHTHTTPQTWAPLSAATRAKFNETAAVARFKQLEGLDCMRILFVCRACRLCFVFVCYAVLLSSYVDYHDNVGVQVGTRRCYGDWWIPPKCVCVSVCVCVCMYVCVCVCVCFTKCCTQDNYPCVPPKWNQCLTFEIMEVRL